MDGCLYTRGSLSGGWIRRGTLPCLAAATSSLAEPSILVMGRIASASNNGNADKGVGAGCRDPEEALAEA